MPEPLRPRRGGFLRPFGCGEFIRQFMAGEGLHGSPRIDPVVGAPQADMAYHYKTALLATTAADRAAKEEERQAKREHRAIDPARIEALAKKHLEDLPYKTSSCRYNSFVHYFSNLRRLGWVEKSGLVERSAFQDHYPKGQPRVFYRLTPAGWAAPASAWANPRLALYGSKRK